MRSPTMRGFITITHAKLGMLKTNAIIASLNAPRIFANCQFEYRSTTTE